MKKKVLAFAAATVLAATAVGGLAGCGGSRANTIKIFLLADSHEVEFYEEYFDQMEQELKDDGYDYTIDFLYEQESNYYSALDGDIQGGDTPDIFYVRPNELMKYKTEIVSLQSFADEYGFTQDASKRIADLNDIYDTALQLYRFNPATNALGNASDDLYAFPKDLSTQQLGYNRNLLSQYTEEIKKLDSHTGAKMKMPWEMNFETENYSWDDFLKITSKIEEVAGDGIYALDVPSLEVIAHSYGVESLIDFSTGTVVDPRSGALHDAIEMQTKFLSSGASNYKNATYAGFSGLHVCFYGEVGSWQIGAYNEVFNKDANGNVDNSIEGWGVMPWPTKDGSTDWNGLIKSAGYVVSKDCEGDKGEIAKRIALSFMGSDAQEELVKRGLSLPLRKSVQEDYLKAENDTKYFPKTRKYFLDVVSGDNGFFPTEYKTFDALWYDPLSTAFEKIWTVQPTEKASEVVMQHFKETDWDTVYSQMQAAYTKSVNDNSVA